jgi:transposase
MLKLDFSAKDQEALLYERYHHPHPRVQRKMESLWLKSHGLPHHLIATLTAVSENTLRSYFQDYRHGGIEQLKQLGYRGQVCLLTPHRQSLEDHFTNHPPTTAKEAAVEIEQVTGIKRSPTQVRAFLHRIGMQRRMTGILPSKANPEQQADFKTTQLEPRLLEAKMGTRAIFFVDASHFVFSAVMGMLWCFTRIWIKAASGRKRFNVLGALNAVTHELFTVTNDSYINAQTVCELLRKLAAFNLGVPITLVLDNARYQRCALVQDLALSLHIELLFLPAYSPNLNLIERYWKFVKKKVLYAKHYSSFDDYCAAITSRIAQSTTTDKPALDTLLTLNFQTLPNPQN